MAIWQFLLSKLRGSLVAAVGVVLVVSAWRSANEQLKFNPAVSLLGPLLIVIGISDLIVGSNLLKYPINLPVGKPPGSELSRIGRIVLCVGVLAGLAYTLYLTHGPIGVSG